MGRKSVYLPNALYAIKVCRVLMKLIGVWPLTEVTLKTRVTKVFLRVTVSFLILFIAIPPILFAIFKSVTFHDKMKAAGASGFFCIVLIMYFALMIRQSSIKKCLLHVLEDWTNLSKDKEQDIMVMMVKKGRGMLVVSISFGYFNSFLYRLVLPLATGKTVVNENVTIRPLIHTTYYVFFDPQKTPTYEFLFVFQWFCASMLYLVVNSVCGLTVLFVMHSCAQMRILLDWMDELGNVKDGISIKKKFAIIVEHHVRIVRFKADSEEVLQEMCFVQILGYTFVMCLVEYYLITGWENNQLITTLASGGQLAAVAFNILLICYIGEQLTTHGEELYIKSKTLMWYDMPPAESRGIMMIIMNSTKPTKLVAGKFIDLSLNNFGVVMKTSVAYLNLLRKSS